MRLGQPLVAEGWGGVELKKGDPGYWSGPSKACLADLEAMRQAQIAGVLSLMRWPVIIGAALALTACTTPNSNPAIQTKTVYVDVPTPCTATVPKPVFDDSAAMIKLAPDVFAVAKLYAAGRQQHYAYEAALEAANSGCHAPAP